jgi:splicing factor 3B subunit 3
VHCFKYKKQENVLYEFADDIAPRYISATLPLDYNSMAIGDKFSNFCITRLPTEISIKVGPSSPFIARSLVHRHMWCSL